MKRKHVLGSTAALLSALAVSSCGSTESAEGAFGAQKSASSCRSGDMAPDVASGAVDDIRVKPGGRLNKSQNEYAAGTTDELLNAYPSIALVTATMRSEPVAVAGSVVGARATDTSLSRPAASVDREFQVLRPTTLQVKRQLRGTVEDCLELAIPGGAVGDFAEDDASFPRRIAVGEPMLAFFSEVDLEQQPPGLSLLLAPQADGTYLLPYPNAKPIDVANWQLPSYERPAETLPGGVKPERTE